MCQPSASFAGIGFDFRVGFHVGVSKPKLCRFVFGKRRELLDIPPSGYASFLKIYKLIGYRQKLMESMLGDDQCHAVSFKLSEDLDKRLRPLCIQIRGGFVKYQDLRTVGYCSRKSDALFLSA